MAFGWKGGMGETVRTARRCLVAALLTTMATMSPASQAGQAARPRLFPALDLSLLESPDRDQSQKPDLIMDALGIADGAVVADLGAGGGWFTIKLARRVGPNGRVYAEDIQRSMIEAIQQRVQRENLANVTTVLGTATDPGLPQGLDAVLIVDAYHEIEDPITLLTNVKKTLKPSGRLGIVGYNPGNGGPGPAADQRINPEAVKRAASAAGLTFVTRADVPPFQFLLVFAPR